MSLSQEILGLELNDVTLQSLTDYFNAPRTESDVLEFKSYVTHGQDNHNLKEKAVLKTICAMLNSDGGILIWGSPISQIDPQTNSKFCQGALSPVDRAIAHDDFMSKIVQRLNPLPSGIRLKVLVENNTSVCIFEIQKSAYPIHRFDERYWIRLDGQTVIAPHHYVEAIIKQVRYPAIEGYICLSEYKQEAWAFDGLGFVQGRVYHWIGIRHIITNWSGLINEEDVTFKVMTEKGRFSGYGHPGATNYQYSGRVYQPKSVHPILYYGEPLTETYYLLVDPAELIESNTVDLFFTVGGRKSPLKHSEYKIHVNNLTPAHPENGLEVLVENKLVADLHTEMDITKEQLLHALIGR